MHEIRIRPFFDSTNTSKCRKCCWIEKDATAGLGTDGILTFIIEKMNDHYLDLSETFVDMVV